MLTVTSTPIEIPVAAKMIFDFRKRFQEKKLRTIGGFITKASVVNLSNTYANYILAHYCFDDSQKPNLFMAFETGGTNAKLVSDKFQITDDKILTKSNLTTSLSTNRCQIRKLNMNVLNNIHRLNYKNSRDSNEMPPSFSLTIIDDSERQRRFLSGGVSIHHLKENKDDTITPARVTELKDNFENYFVDDYDMPFSCCGINTSTLRGIMELPTAFNADGSVKEFLPVIGVRYYFGYEKTDSDLDIRLILVPVDAHGNDILNYNQVEVSRAETDPFNFIAVKPIEHNTSV